jgi:CubicO group peptidase (beta-lactamase class C family)
MQIWATTINIEHLLTMTSGLAWDEWGAAHGTLHPNQSFLKSLKATCCLQ